MGPLLTIKELATYLKMSQQTVYRLAKKGEIPGVKVGGSWRFQREAIDHWLTGQAATRLVRREQARPRRVLVVDDDPIACQLLDDVLTSRGHTVTTVLNGAAALEEVKQDGFDVVFLDLFLPGMGGVEVFKAIKAIDPQAVVVIVTAYPDSNLLQEALSEGPLVVLSKPVSIKDIVGALDLVGK